ncbi:MAG TPA: YiiX/YebB-like N1pC/P60 family cysteine hydrolase [Flavisolibacter sp.]|jgi:hypothetical protein
MATKFLFAFIICVVALCCTFRDKQPAFVPVVGSPYDSAYNLIKEAEVLVKEGDLVLRNGQEFSSQLVKSFCRNDQSFSHAGLVFFRDGYPLVYHIVPSDDNPTKKLRVDSLKNFSNPRKNFGFGIYRYDLKQEEISQLRALVETWKDKEVVFDSTFNLKTDDQMYCSEMIKKGIERTTKNRVTIPTTKPTEKEAQFFAATLHLPIAYTSDLDVVAIDNLFVNPHCKQVRRFDFNPTK